MKVNGELTRTHESYSGSAFNTLGVQADAVDTVTLESVDIAQDEWISLLEVRQKNALALWIFVHARFRKNLGASYMRPVVAFLVVSLPSPRVSAGE